MAHLLKANGRTTLHQVLIRYCRLILSIALIMNIVVIIFHMISVKGYSDTMKQVLSLNKYYEQFDMVNNDLHRYITSGREEEKEDICIKIQKLSTVTEELMKLNVSPEFKRDIADIATMMVRYEEKATEIMNELSLAGEKLSSTDYSKILLIHDEAVDVYERIDAEFKPLHLQLLSYASFRQETILSKSRIYYMVFLVLMLIFVIYGSILGKNLSNQIVDPIQTMTRAAEEICDGKLFEYKKIHFRENYYKEIEILMNVFNKMALQIKEQIRIIEEDAKTKMKLREHEVEKLKILNLLRTSELKALQLQMNPHFLFNTLNMISKTAYIESAGKTVFLLQKTAQLLRYSLDYMGKSVTLAREIESLGNYVYLQEERFGKRIHFEFELDERFHQTEVPCLILQPLVENSIIHGIGLAIEGGKILIRTQYNLEQKIGIISISDNGAGIDEVALRSIQNNLNSDKEQREKLGLANVYRRLQIFFEDKVTMEIISKPQEGTTIRIMIPVAEKRREDQNVAHDNC